MVSFGSRTDHATAGAGRVGARKEGRKLRGGDGGSVNQLDKRAARGIHVTTAQFDSKSRNAGWIGDEAMGARGTANVAHNGSSSVSRRGGVEPTYILGSTLHVKHTRA